MQRRCLKNKREVINDANVICEIFKKLPCQKCSRIFLKIDSYFLKCFQKIFQNFTNNTFQKIQGFLKVSKNFLKFFQKFPQINHS